ncbi:MULTISPECIES: 50S ribosomal protein L4 [unclassified Roseitalea]|uniref:50S ribosomal protein L4 n=1 Tax=unclassified Roseitalea TaxID=2639107 RepID=UPI00273FCB8D|nr:MULTISPECIES: 50S ribosomal protein L4 [unclassified Roseitalea]
MEQAVKTLAGEQAGTIELPETVFGLEPRADILQRMVRYQLARRQAGTHKTKGRSEIAKTGAKMYRQKGTGRARHHSAAAPQFRGGGKAHGPKSRDHAIDLPKKVRALALRHALSAKARAGGLIVVDELASADARTKTLAGQFAGLGLSNALVIGGPELDDGFRKAAANIANVDVLPVAGINVYDILRRNTLVLSRDAVEALKERLK